MLSVQAIAEALMRPDVTVAELAPALGKVESVGPDEYQVKPADPAVFSVSLGILDGHDAHAAPAWIRLFFSGKPTLTLTEGVPGCTEWKMVPNNPSASPYLYACRFKGSSEHLEVQFFALLSDDIKNPGAHLENLLFQRNSWT